MGDWERWKPEFAGLDAIYGVSSRIETDSDSQEVETDEMMVEEGTTHWISLDGAMASSWALPDRKQFWTVSLLNKTSPDRSLKTGTDPNANEERLYGARVSLGGYSIDDTKKILQRYENAWHPTAGNFGNLFSNSERIVRTPLYYRAWEESEIGGANVVVIGDAARLMLPSSGQGT